MFLGSHLGHPSWFLAIFKLALTGPFWIVVSGAFAGFFFLPPFFLPFGAMSRLFRRTVVLDVSGFPDDCNVNYIAEKICGSFNVGDVVSIQFMPGKSVRVSFKDESIKTTVLSSDSFVVDGVASHVRGGGPRPENVLVFRYPFEGDHSLLKDVMSRFGVVHDIRHRRWGHCEYDSFGGHPTHYSR